MTLTRADVVDALQAYWDRKDLQYRNAKIAHAVGAGTAGSVRGGRQFDPVAAVLAKPFLEAGYAPDNVRVHGIMALPGFYRPTKDWDLVVTVGGVVAAAFELKALGGPSFGNNANNRIEEALGSSTDIRQATVDGRFGPEQPWIGYLLVVEDHPKSRSPQRRPRPIAAGTHDPVWENRTYQQRMAIGVERMLALHIYDTACVLVSSPEHPDPIEPSPAVDWTHFTAAINARITYLAELGYPPTGQPLASG